MRIEISTTKMKCYKALVTAAAVILVLFVLINITLLALYHQRAYPNSTVLGQQVGNSTYLQVEDKLQKTNPLPRTIQLTYNKQSTLTTMTKLGISLNAKNIQPSITSGRSWLPITNLFIHHNLAAPVSINNYRLQQTAQTFKNTFHEVPSPARIAWNGSNFQIVQATTGYQLDIDKLDESLLQALDNSSRFVTVPVLSVPPLEKITNISKVLQELQPELHVTMTYHYQDKSIKATPQEIAALFTQSGSTFKVSDGITRSYIGNIGNKLFGTVPNNIDDAVTKTDSAINSAQDVDVTLTKFAKTVTFTYCTAVSGVDVSQLPELENKLYSVYHDARGWSLDGQVIFNHVSSGCDFTVWLTASSQVPTFGAICDTTWSCTVGKNIVINFDRWERGTSTWNTVHPGGALDDYRSLAINHETGHELSFGHQQCGGVGQLAPVMQQQSIDLGGCEFNAWPLPYEQLALRQLLAL